MKHAYGTDLEFSAELLEEAYEELEFEWDNFCLMPYENDPFGTELLWAEFCENLSTWGI